MKDLTAASDDYYALRKAQPELSPEDSLMCDCCGDAFPAARVRLLRRSMVCGPRCFDRLAAADFDDDE